jgi:adenylosuccinate lyase
MTRFSEAILAMSEPHDQYESPLGTRYASQAMRRLFSPTRRIREWRRLWIALATAQRELGLPIGAEQIAELEAKIDDIDLAAADEFERRFRHDVMAHVHAYGVVAPSAKGILHLGATSCFVTDNGDQILFREALDHLLTPLVAAVDRLRAFALEHRALPCVAYTHFQPAQLTTVGKRACLWIQDLLDDVMHLERAIQSMRLRGVKGTTGTQASFLALFDGDESKVKALEAKVAAAVGFDRCYGVTGQTYPRKLDFEIVAALTGVAISASKFATDLRLLAHEREVEEPFGKDQIGSSAMAYKRNPMRSERICSLSRFVSSLLDSAAQTAMNQWLERTLDDSANRRLVLPEAFLATDGLLHTLLDVTSGLVVNREPIAAHVARELPFMATEELMMAATRKGGDRQEVHEAVRVHSHAASAEVKAGRRNDLFDRIGADASFAAVKDMLPELSRPERFIGRSPRQVEEFIAAEVEPVVARHRDRLAAKGEVRI